MEFKRLKEDVSEIAAFLKSPEIEFCDMSVGAKYIWRDEFVTDYAIEEGSLIIKESAPGYKDAFYFPIGGDTDKALSLIEEYCTQKGIPLLFCCIDNKTAAMLSARYPFAKVYNDRNWSDYIYSAESFKTYSGKKLSGQRNHVNKFKRTYPDYIFKKVGEEDVPRIGRFLKEFERGEDFSVWSKAEEERKVFGYISDFRKLGQVGGYIEAGGNIVAIAFGERVNDTLIVHVEKGLKQYEGVYPVMAQEFARAFAVDGVKYINREEDCGDMGLRISKLQYHPIEIKEKNFVRVETLFDKIIPPVVIKTERLTVDDIVEGDGEAYSVLYTDGEINRYYGYDYREDIGEEKPSAEYFISFMQSLKERREEYSFAVRLDGKMIGEVVLYNFDFFGGAEIGFRFFKEYEGRGYAYESVRAVMDFAAANKALTLRCRAFKENERSVKLIERLGFNRTGETEKQYFYRLDF